MDVKKRITELKKQGKCRDEISKIIATEIRDFAKEAANNGVRLKNKVAEMKAALEKLKGNIKKDKGEC